MHTEVSSNMPGVAHNPSTGNSLEPVCHFLRKVRLSELDDERIVVVLHELMTVQGALKVWAKYPAETRRKYPLSMQDMQNVADGRL
jgi:hypothetical protein